jgi:GNAT superfamily N-acetyltransferase
MISVSPAGSIEDFEILADLCRKLGAWDAEAVRPHGVSAEELAAIFHPARNAQEIAAKFCAADAAMLLARVDGHPAGCVAFEPFDDEAIEVEKFFVDAPFRGKGVGRALMEAAMAEIARGRRRKVLIHTTFYMESAVAVYTAFGFKPCPPFRETPIQVRHTDVFMSRTLPAWPKAGQSGAITS